MIAYIDTAALLRIVLHEPGAVDDLRSYEALLSTNSLPSNARVQSTA
jgi:hypothetical protein